jgi:hypothetical protein
MSDLGVSPKPCVYGTIGGHTSAGGWPSQALVRDGSKVPTQEPEIAYSPQEDHPVKLQRCWISLALNFEETDPHVEEQMVQNQTRLTESGPWYHNKQYIRIHTGLQAHQGERKAGRDTAGDALELADALRSVLSAAHARQRRLSLATMKAYTFKPVATLQTSQSTTLAAPPREQPVGGSGFGRPHLTAVGTSPQPPLTPVWERCTRSDHAARNIEIARGESGQV